MGTHIRVVSCIWSFNSAWFARVQEGLLAWKAYIRHFNFMKTVRLWGSFLAYGFIVISYYTGLVGSCRGYNVGVGWGSADGCPLQSKAFVGGTGTSKMEAGGAGVLSCGWASVGRLPWMG